MLSGTAWKTLRVWNLTETSTGMLAVVVVAAAVMATAGGFARRGAAGGAAATDAYDMSMM